MIPPRLFPRALLAIALVAAVAPGTARAAGTQGPGLFPPCKDGAYTFNSSHWTKAYPWRFRARSTPSGFSRAAALKALKRSVSNITGSHNDCHLADRVGARAVYRGTTSRRPNITSSAACGRYDGVSVVAFGALPANYLGLTCYWTRNGRTVEADVLLNKISYRWTIDVGSKCVNKWALEAAATHEFGHVFGLGHVSEITSPNLTMSPVIMACQKSEATLGLGDIKGLRAKY